MDDTDRMVAWQLQNDPAFRTVFINGLAANLRGKPADEYDDASPDERRRYAEQQLALYGDLIVEASYQVTPQQLRAKGVALA